MGVASLLLCGVLVQAAPPEAKTEASSPFIISGGGGLPPRADNIASNAVNELAATIATKVTSTKRADLLAAWDDILWNRRDAAIVKLEAILRNDPNTPAAWEALGWAYWQAGRTDDAMALWAKWQQLDRAQPTPYNLLAQGYAARNQPDKAIECYLTSLQLKPDQFETAFALGRMYRWTGELDRAIRLFRSLLDKDPNRNDIKRELARALVENHQFDEAAPLWDDMLKVSPTNQEYMVRQANVLAHTGKARESQELLGKVLGQDALNPQALQVQADIAEAGAQPQDAIAPLRTLIANAREPQEKIRYRTRLVRLLVRLHHKSPANFPAAEPLAVVRDMLRDEPHNVDANLMLAELLQLQQEYVGAANQYVQILRTLNPYNLRARRGLFDTYAALRRFGDAQREHEIITAFNPLDPYANVRLARLAEAQGDLKDADQALQQLQAQSSRGAVAVLRYYGLTASEAREFTTVQLFQEQMTALKKAGFRFITPDEIPLQLAKMKQAGAEAVAAERVVCVTFDDARRDTMRLGAEVAQQLGIKLAMHVPVGSVERGGPFLCSWDVLKQYQDAGVWVLGSYLMDADDMRPIGRDRQLGSPLANRLWLEREGRLETAAEFAARLQSEYLRSKVTMESRLGRKVTFMAYPQGDIGQKTICNASEAIFLNLNAAKNNYEVALIESPFGYAVSGDNPLLYQRYEVERGLSGADLVQRILDNHPYYLALKMRAQLAGQQGKVHQGKSLVADLKQSGYPEQMQNKVTDYLYGVRPVSAKAGDETNRVLNVTLEKPYTGVSVEYFQDNLEARNWRLRGFGGVDLTARFKLEANASFGQMSQPLTNSLPEVPPPPPIPEIKLNEVAAGLSSSFTFPNGWQLQGELALRQCSGTVPTNLNGQTKSFDALFFQYAIEGQAKPFLPLDLTLRWEHDVQPDARELVKETTYNMAAFQVVYSIFDAWDLNGSGQHYAISDGNTRDHLQLLSDWLVWEAAGIHVGLGYAYANAADYSSDYWTPYKLNRYFGEVALRGRYARATYNLRVRYGMGQQGIRPEVETRYQERLAQAYRDRWPQSSIDEMLANPPNDDWMATASISGSTTIKLGGHWEALGYISYLKVPAYNELNVSGGLKYRF